MRIPMLRQIIKSMIQGESLISKAIFHTQKERNLKAKHNAPPKCSINYLFQVTDA